ncbi:hypothetical protein [Methylobacterium sp. Leaf88]|uniref:hypothetical protein n=1 Tax=Methylobacterium sp. Leaf88 TaxID=1736244 RepID=UPI0012E89D66|nr:hypothetical protein [Methylobacterium sp. Leaf88]
MVRGAPIRATISSYDHLVFDAAIDEAGFRDRLVGGRHRPRPRARPFVDHPVEGGPVERLADRVVHPGLPGRPDLLGQDVG